MGLRRFTSLIEGFLFENLKIYIKPRLESCPNAKLVKELKLEFALQNIKVLSRK